MESSKQSNKISDIVKLKRMLKKWRIQASNTNNKDDNNNAKKTISFLKRTLSFTDLSTNIASSNAVPKGFLAVLVGEEMKRFIIPTNYLTHQAFCLMLKDAEDEFGFQQEGVLRIPCEVALFENILRMVEAKRSSCAKKLLKLSRNDGGVCGSTEGRNLSKSYLPLTPTCR